MLFKFARRRRMDPLQVSMTGVRMGERVLQVGCDDPALLAGLASKVGLSGASAVAVRGESEAGSARAIAAKTGALVDVRPMEAMTLPFDPAAFDMVVIDDTRGRFAADPEPTRRAVLAEAFRVTRVGGRVEIIEGQGGGLFGGRIARPADYDAERDLGEAGFRPIRLLAEKDGFRFFEGLRRG